MVDVRIALPEAPVGEDLTERVCEVVLAELVEEFVRRHDEIDEYDDGFDGFDEKSGRSTKLEYEQVSCNEEEEFGLG